MSYETIFLVGGPADGRIQSWDGADYLELRDAAGEIKFHEDADERWKELFAIRHTYKRDPVNRDRFIFMGSH